MKTHIPNQISRNGSLFVNAGPGRFAGSHHYVCHATSETLELWKAVITATSAVSDLANVPGNAALAEVEVPKNIMTGKGPTNTVGTQLLLEVTTRWMKKPLAKEAWPLARPDSPTPPRPAPGPYRTHAPAPSGPGKPAPVRPQRTTGFVIRSNGPYGFVSTPISGVQAFVHHSALPPGVLLREGMRLQYTLCTNEKGYICRDVQVLAA